MIKVYGTGSGKYRRIVAASSAREAQALLNARADYFCETGNDMEIALGNSAIGTVFERRVENAKSAADWRVRT